MRLQNQTYHQDQCVTFLKTAEQFGGLSNMAGGYPLSINNVSILTSEALYQACRFPHKPEIQRVIIAQKSPMTAKMKSKPYIAESRPDWDKVRVHVMWWCLRIKLAQHWEKFGKLLLSTGDKPIVEISYRDQFWGAKPVASETLEGINVLGQLLTHLREHLKNSDAEKLKIVQPLAFSQFLLMNTPIGVVEPENQEPMEKTIILLRYSTKKLFSPSDEVNLWNNNEPPEEGITPLPAFSDNASPVQLSLWNIS